MEGIEIKSTNRVFGGILYRVSHFSNCTGTPMTFAVYLPKIREQVAANEKFPYLVYLSGLSCTDENVCQKSGAFKLLSELQLAFVAPDTSPRGANIPGEAENWDFGLSAGFYLDATVAPWSNNYKMYSYVVSELPALLRQCFPELDDSRVGITGHSMGGHGALTMAFKNSKLYRSVSAFAPICNPINCPWGKKAFSGYLGEDKLQWAQYDSCELIRASAGQERAYDDILIDVGTADGFLKAGQLLPEAFQAVCDSVGQHVTVNRREGFDHSYYFVASFMDDHIKFHAARLQR